MNTLRELMTVESIVTSEYLANVNQVTSRTIQEDIKHLDRVLTNHGAKVMSIRGKGYRLEIINNDEFRKLLQQVFEKEETDKINSVPDTPEDRTVFLMRRLLLAESYLKIEELADEILVSKSTLQNDIKVVKTILQNYGLKLSKRPNYGLKVTGSEVKLRFCLAEYLFDRSKEAKSNIFSNQMADLIEEDYFSDIWDVILERIKENGITLSDIAINNLFIHIAIAYKRIKSGHHVSMVSSEIKKIANQKEYHVARQIVKDAEKKLNVTFPEVEVAYIALHLMGTKMITQNQMKVDDLKPIIDDEHFQLTMLLLQQIEEKMKLGISSDEELMMALSIHLKPAINHSKYGMNIRNPLLADIKKRIH